MARILTFLLASFGLAGCDSPERSTPLPIKQLIESYENVPLAESIHDVSRGLAGCDVMMPTESVHEQGQPLRIKTATDNQGREWAYAYTDESELLAAFPDGSPFVELKFRDAFAIVAADSRFGGIFINHTDKYKYLIPREVFDSVQSELGTVSETDASTPK